MRFFEKNTNISLLISNLRLIEQTRSENYRKIQLFYHDDLGKVLILDGEIQHIENWSPLYHEVAVHLPTAFIKKIERVLILGGGDFFIAKEALKYRSVKQVTMIDHDGKVIELMSKYYKHARKILRDKRFTLLINDAFVEINKLKQKFDLIVNDAVNLIEYSKIKRVDFFKKLSSLVHSEGICSDLIYRHVFERRTTKKTIELLKLNKFKTVFSLVTVPEYPGVLHLLCLWGISNRIQQNISAVINLIQKDWIHYPKKNPCEYYNPKFLKYYLYLPSYLKRVK